LINSKLTLSCDFGTKGPIFPKSVTLLYISACVNSDFETARLACIHKKVVGVALKANLKKSLYVKQPLIYYDLLIKKTD